MVHRTANFINSLSANNRFLSIDCMLPSISFCYFPGKLFIRVINLIDMELVATAPVAEVEVTGTKKYSFSIRLWHWLNAVIITGYFMTVMINSTVMKAWTNALLITDNLKGKRVKITEDQARSVASALSDKVWAVHTYLGAGWPVLIQGHIGIF